MQARAIRKYVKIGVLVVILALIVGYFLIPSFQFWVNSLFKLFTSMSVTTMAAYIRSFGIYAVIVSFLLMVFQSVAAPLPAFLITFANAAVFGWWQGAILSWASAMAGAVVCFYIARLLGRDAVYKLTSKMAMDNIDGFFTKYGKNTVLICRLLPFVSFDFVSYGAGLTSMGFWGFLVATGIGQLPATLVYSYIGGMLTGPTKVVFTALLIIFALSAMIFLLKQVYNERQRKNAQI